ncbi:hypothetical protein IGI04_034301 [Brassica rapa subsp. trilocularis]|uniref:Uncharacterized protein n=1 Tax=Brassica rapa subsp. trilocularis TaxID=1813537 RepID=A0ABQ7L8C1_BRACM|nr:hypothetical protein IGI04_034301 [Brassica rapa subsp. trilocularis]
MMSAEAMEIPEIGIDDDEGWEAGSIKWMGDGSILSVRMKTGRKDGEDGRLDLPFNPI